MGADANRHDHALGDASTMAAIDEIKLDTLSLADLKAAETFTYDIPLPDGVDNLSGVTSVTLTILFDDIDSLTVDATQFGYENLTTERDVTVVTSTLSVTLRGTSTALAQVNEENLRVVADPDERFPTRTASIPSLQRFMWTGWTSAPSAAIR